MHISLYFCRESIHFTTIHTYCDSEKSTTGSIHIMITVVYHCDYLQCIVWSILRCKRLLSNYGFIKQAVIATIIFRCSKYFSRCPICNRFLELQDMHITTSECTVDYKPHNNTHLYTWHHITYALFIHMELISYSHHVAII